MSFRYWLSVILVTSVALCAPMRMYSQSQDAPKIEVFGGYSWYHPGGTINGAEVNDFKEGWAGQFTYNLNHWAGIAIDANGHYGSHNGNTHSIAFGPQFKLRLNHVTPFAEALLGVQRIAPEQLPVQNSAVFLLGGGLDVPVTPRFSIRPIQFDYVNTNYSKLSPAGTSNFLNGVRLQAGVLFNFGLPAQQGTVSSVCSAEPQTIDAGTPVKISVAPAGFLPKRVLSYSYASTGGKLAGNTSTASVDTAGLAPGSYMVSAKVVDNGKGKHQQTASCQASFSVKEPPKHPPVLSISADPATVRSGDASAITANGSSPDNRPVSYECKATDGKLKGNGPTYTLDTAGVPDNTVSITCTVTDDRNLSASARTSVKVNVPPPPPSVKSFGSIEFKRDVKRPTRVDNEAKGELDRYADALAATPDAKGVVVGYAAATEVTAKKHAVTAAQMAALRAVNTKDYLVTEKGVDGARVEPRTGTGDEQKAELWIVPAGASFPAEGTQVVDQTKVKAIRRVAIPARKTHKKTHRKGRAHKS
jgi:hypothetical protein